MRACEREIFFMKDDCADQIGRDAERYAKIRHTKSQNNRRRPPPIINFAAKKI